MWIQKGSVIISGKIVLLLLITLECICLLEQHHSFTTHALQQSRQLLLSLLLCLRCNTVGHKSYLTKYREGNKNFIKEICNTQLLDYFGIFLRVYLKPLKFIFFVFFIPCHTKSGGVLLYPPKILKLWVSVRPSVRPSISASFPDSNLSSFWPIFFKLHGHWYQGGMVWDCKWAKFVSKQQGYGPWLM